MAALSFGTAAFVKTLLMLTTLPSLLHFDGGLVSQACRIGSFAQSLSPLLGQMIDVWGAT